MERHTCRIEQYVDRMQMESLSECASKLISGVMYDTI